MTGGNASSQLRQSILLSHLRRAKIICLILSYGSTQLHKFYEVARIENYIAEEVDAKAPGLRGHIVIGTFRDKELTLHGPEFHLVCVPTITYVSGNTVFIGDVAAVKVDYIIETEGLEPAALLASVDHDTLFAVHDGDKESVQLVVVHDEVEHPFFALILPTVNDTEASGFHCGIGEGLGSRRPRGIRVVHD